MERLDQPKMTVPIPSATQPLLWGLPVQLESTALLDDVFLSSH